MDDTINEKTINKRFNAKESNYKTSAPIIGNSLESRIFASRRDVDKIKDLLTKNNADLSILNDEYIKYFNVRQGQKGYLTKAQSIHDNAFEILDQAPNYISGLYYEIFRLKALKNLSKEQDEELKKALKQVNLDAILDLAGVQRYKLMATKIKTALNALIRAKKIID